MSKCYLCPRACGADRKNGILGFCGEGDDMRIARYSLHMWEEPPISFERGSGTIFFSGCVLRCEFCQNSVISRSHCGKTVDAAGIADIFKKLDTMKEIVKKYT